MVRVTNRILMKVVRETTKILNTKQRQLQNIKWTNGESNLDVEYSKLSCDCFKEAWNVFISENTDYKDVQMRCYVPDIKITFQYTDNTIDNFKVELKSSKNKKLPGSTIQKLNINQPLIYCLRPKSKNNTFLIKCSQYHHAMGNSYFDLFQDRTPRPFLNFNKMYSEKDDFEYEEKNKTSWIEHYASCAMTRLEQPDKCIHSWQDDMVQIIKQRVIQEFILNTSIEEFKKCKLDSVD